MSEDLPSNNDYQFPEFSPRFRSLLEIHGIPKSAFGQRVGMSRQTVSRYANGETRPDLVCCVKIAQYFHVTLDWLLGIRSPEGRSNPAHDTYQILELYNRASEEDRADIRDILWKYRDTWAEKFMRS